MFMKNTLPTIFLVVFFQLLLSTTTVHAKDVLSLDTYSTVAVNEKVKAETKTNATIKEEKAQEKKETKQEEFTVDGSVTAISVADNTFVVEEKIIVIDLAKISHFRQKGTFTVGSRVKVKGITIDDTMYAQDINVVGTGQGEFQFSTDKKNGNIGIKVTQKGGIDMTRFITVLESFYTLFTQE